MINIGRNININNLNIKPSNIIVCYTTPVDYEENREMLLEDVEGTNGGFLVLEGGHCSCYSWDEVSWYGTLYEYEELKKLAMADFNRRSTFWHLVREHFNWR